MRHRHAATVFLVAIATIIFSLRPSAGAATVPETEGPRPLAIDMGTPFHDHAVLQRGMKVPVWGWSKPGANVTVSFAGQTKTTVAAKDGSWMLELDPLIASAEPAEMLISDSTGKSETLKDILVGEVWMCSGQSNMQWLAGKCIVGRKLIPELLARVEAGDEPMPIIREGKVTDVFSSLYPTKRASGQWSSDWMNFSAIAFAFAYDIAKELQVPVGIVNSAFSTTKIQAWVPREGFAAGTDPYTRDIYREILESDVAAPEHDAAWDVYVAELMAWAKDSAARAKADRPIMDRPDVPGIMNGNRDATWMCNGKIMPMAPYAIRGAIWNQGYASQSEGVVYRNNLHSLIRGWRAVFGQPDLPVYFHQFYAGKGGSDDLRLSNTSEMRLGTWLAHREIPNAAMASQIDIVGGIHYFNKAVPGQRLARHALKRQYAQDIVANGPMYKDYKVKGRKLILELDHAKGLQVGQSHSGNVFADPTRIEDGEPQVRIFFLADKDLTWHRAEVEIKGERIELSAPGLKEPRGVAYGWNGVGTQPSIYNAGMLPMTPFMVYDHKFVISGQWELDHIAMANPVPFMTWPLEYIPIAGKEVDPASYGLQYENRKLWLLSPQFAHNGVIQADVPTRVYGKALPKSVVKVDFADFTKSITMGDEQDEWEMTVPAMPASAEPKLLHVTCTLDGELAHERKITNLVVGDVWYVAAHEHKLQPGPGVPKQGPAPLEAWDDFNPQLRMFMSFGKRSESMPTRYKMNASGYPRSRFFPRWSPAVGLPQALAKRIHTKTGKPVGVIILDPGDVVPIKAWVGYDDLSRIPAWKADAEALYSRYVPDPQAYIRNAEAYVESWAAYWQNVKRDPSFSTGAMPSFPGATRVNTVATSIYNQSICAFSPGNFKGILCLTGKGFVAEDEGAAFGPKFSVMANSWKDAFARGSSVIDPHFVYVLPGEALAPKITQPSGIQGASTAYTTEAWLKIERNRQRQDVVGAELAAFLDAAVVAVYE